VARLSRLYQPAVSVLVRCQTVVEHARAGVGRGQRLFSGLFSPEAAIHCFEVDPLALHLLQQNALGLGATALCIRWDWRGRIAAEPVASGRRILRPKWGVEQLLPFREARAALKELGLEPIDVLRVATGGDEVEVLTSLQEQLKDIKVIYVEFTSEQDRKQIDQMLDPYPSPLAGGDRSRPKRELLCYHKQSFVFVDNKSRPWRGDIEVMNPTIIVTSAADSKFFELVQGTILSIREKATGATL
jgi:hypothetical protein